MCLCALVFCRGEFACWLEAPVRIISRGDPLSLKLFVSTAAMSFVVGLASVGGRSFFSSTVPRLGCPTRLCGVIDHSSEH